MIGVVVINFGDPERTIRFVREECPKIRQEHRVAVVDNGSSGDSFTRLTEALGAEAVILPSRENLGFARGNNLGADYLLSETGVDYLLFVNNDIVFTDPDVADRLADRLAALPEAGMIGPRVVGLDGRAQSPEPFQTFAERHLLPYWGRFFLSRPALDHRLSRNYAETAEEGFHYRIMGSFMLMRSADFTACGGMDPHTFLYAEEAILSERLKAIGKGVWYDPEVSVLHEHGATTGRYFDRRRLRRIRFRSECYYYRNYAGGIPAGQLLAAWLTLLLKTGLGR